MAEKPNGRISIKLNGQLIEGKREQPLRQAAGYPEQREGISFPKKPPIRADLPDRFQANPVSNFEVPAERIEAIEENAMDRLLEVREKAKATAARTPQPQREKFQLVQTEAVSDEVEVEESERFRRWRFRFPNGPFPRFLATAVSATAIGLGFGFFVLNVFTQNEFSHSYKTVLDGTLQTLTANPDPAVGANTTGDGKSSKAGAELAVNQSGTNHAGESNIALQIPEQSFIMAQIGAFQAKDAAEIAIAQLEKEGYPHFLYKADEKLYLFGAAAANRDDLLGMASSFKKKGIDIFIKEVKLPGIDKTLSVKQAAGTNQMNGGLASFFTTGLDMARTLSVWSSHTGNNAQSAPLPAEEINGMKENHRRFLEASRAVELPADWQPLFSGMVNGMNQAIAAQAKMSEAIAGKKAENAESYAWQVQTGVLAYLENYTKWIQLLP